MTSQEVQKLILSFQNRLLSHAKPKSIDLRADWNLVISKAERVQSDYLFNTVDYQIILLVLSFVTDFNHMHAHNSCHARFELPLTFVRFVLL